MIKREAVVEFILKAGVGSEANVKLELRTEFPGIGGTIITHEGVATALREEHSPTAKSGHRMFLRHAIIKKLEDFFYRSGVYVFAHIPRPLGSISRHGEKPYEAYLYEWAVGSEGFSWETIDSEGKSIPIELSDWNKFVTSFSLAGIDMALDCTDPDEGRISKNIIHQFPVPIDNGLRLCSLWKRIDFGYASVPIDFDKLSRFLRDKKDDLISVLRSERYETLLLLVEYLIKDNQMRETDIGRLDVLIGTYRCSSLGHYTSRGLGTMGMPVFLGPRTEFLTHGEE